MPDIEDRPLITINVTVKDGKVVQIDPPNPVCTVPCFVEWQVFGAAPGDCVISIDKSDGVFQRENSPNPLVIRFFNRCTVKNSYKYSFRNGDGLPYDPSIDNEPKN